MNLKTLRQTLATALEDAGIDYSTSAFPPLLWSSRQRSSSSQATRGSRLVTIGRPASPQVEVSFRLTCIVANLDNQGSLDQLESLVFAVLDNLPRGWEVGDVSPPSVETIGPSDLLVSDLQVTTITTPS
jgi:hypothetical protein